MKNKKIILMILFLTLFMFSSCGYNATIDQNSLTDNVTNNNGTGNGTDGDTNNTGTNGGNTGGTGLGTDAQPKIR